MTEFIVHIGPHKTGTSYLQTTLNDMRGDLAERGIHVPAVWNASPVDGAHAKLVRGIKTGAFDLLREQVQAMLAGHPNYVVITCEGLSRFDAGQIAGLRALFGSAPVRIVYYVRRWPERLPSLWHESVKFGLDATLPEFFAKNVTEAASTAMWDTVMLDQYAAVFGAEAITIVSYSHLTDQDIDIAGHFLAEFVHQPDIAIPPARRHNESLPIAQTETLRALNAIHRESGGKRSPALRHWFLSKIGELDLDSLLNAMQGCVDTIRVDEAAQPFVRPFDALVERYGPCVVAPRHANGLHELRPVEAPFVRQNYLLAAPVVAALDEMYRAFVRSGGAVG